MALKSVNCCCGIVLQFMPGGSHTDSDQKYCEICVIVSDVMMTSETMTQISQYFWSESVWLPPGMNWSTIPQQQFTDFSAMYQTLPLAIGFLAIRLVFEWLAMGVTITCY